MPWTWSVTWHGQRAREAIEVLDRVAGGPFRCGGAGALWTCARVDHRGEDEVTATLLPCDPHDVDPSHRRLLEAPLPDRAA